MEMEICVLRPQDVGSPWRAVSEIRVEEAEADSALSIGIPCLAVAPGHIQVGALLCEQGGDRHGEHVDAVSVLELWALTRFGSVGDLVMLF